MVLDAPAMSKLVVGALGDLVASSAVGELGISVTPHFGVVNAMLDYNAEAPFAVQSPPNVRVVDASAELQLHVVGSHIMPVEIKQQTSDGADCVTDLDGILAINRECSMVVPLMELFHDMACMQLRAEHEANRKFCLKQFKLLTNGTHTIKLSVAQVGQSIGCATHSGVSKLNDGTFLPRAAHGNNRGGKRNHMFNALVLANTIKTMPWDPLLLCDESLSCQRSKSTSPRKPSDRSARFTAAAAVVVVVMLLRWR